MFSHLQPRRLISNTLANCKQKQRLGFKPPSSVFNMFEVYKCRSSSVEWNPSPIVALATSVDESQVAAAREDGSLEIWLVSTGAVGWHCQLTIQGDPNLRASSLVWCSTGVEDLGNDQNEIRVRTIWGFKYCFYVSIYELKRKGKLDFNNPNFQLLAGINPNY